jgi:hypothetical protein
VVVLTRTTSTKDGRVVEYARGIHAASRFAWTYTRPPQSSATPWGSRPLWRVSNSAWRAIGPSPSGDPSPLNSSEHDALAGTPRRARPDPDECHHRVPALSTATRVDDAYQRLISAGYTARLVPSI